MSPHWFDQPGERPGVPRYCARPLPAYRYVPGRHPHPTRDPAGHSYGEGRPEVAAFGEEDWAASEEYLQGVDLFNHGYWWEAHEAWEPLWLAAGRTTSLGLFLQGLIQLAAGHLKRHQGHAGAAARLGADGLAKLGRAPRLGIDVPAFARAAADYLEARSEQPALIVLHIRAPASDTVSRRTA